MITLVTSLYRSEKHLSRFIRDASRVSRYLERHGIEHEFLILPNDPTEQEEFLLRQASLLHARIIPRALESLYATWNAGIAEARYEYVCFWNVDDRRFGPAIRSGIEDLRSGAEVVYFPFLYLRFVILGILKLLAKAVLIVPPRFSNERFSREMHCGPFFMFTKSAFERTGPFDDSFKIAGDFDWCARAASLGLQFRRNGAVAGIFMNDGTTLSGSRDSRHETENERIHARTTT